MDEYYNSEIESKDNEKSKEKTLLDLLDDVTKSIHKTMKKLDEENRLEYFSSKKFVFQLFSY